MKNCMLFLLISLGVIYCQSISITSPQEGETIELFQNYTITWTDDIDDSEELEILMYKGDTTLEGFRCHATGSYQMILYSSNFTAGSDYNIRIELMSDPDIFDETGYFSIKGTNNVKGSISGLWAEANSPYILTDSISIDENETLIIEPNVNILGSHYSISMNVYGNIEVIGEHDNNVNFENVNIMIDNHENIDSSKIEYATVRPARENTEYLLNTTFGKSYLDYGRSIIQTDDGGYMIAGSTNHGSSDGHDIWLIKIDRNMNMLWDKEYKEDGYQYSRSILQTTDGGYIFAGISSTASTFDGFVWKLNSFGDIEWSKVYGMEDKEDNITSMIHTTDGGYVFTGYTSSYGNGMYDIWLVKIDAYGEILWTKTFGDVQSDNGYAVVETEDGGFMITGRWGRDQVPNGKGDLWLIKTDNQGNEQWNQIFGGPDSYDLDWGNDILEIDNGDFVVTGLTESYGAGDKDLWLIKTDSLGNEIWSKTYGGSEYDKGNRILKADDGGYFVLGTKNANWIGSGGDIWLLKTDSEGNMEWEKTFGGSSGDDAEALCDSYEGGIMILGSTWSFGNGATDILVLKTDINGELVIGDNNISIHDNSKIIIRNTIIQNLNNYGIITDNASPVISNNLITGNNGGIKFVNSSPQFIINNTVADNDSSGLYFDANSDGQLMNNILYGNGINQVFLVDDDSDPSFSYNNIQGGSAGFGLGSGVIYSGSYENNIDADPLFEEGSYFITGGSPCLNIGYPGLTPELLSISYLPNTDIAGNPRLYGEIDMGAYERQTVGIEDENIINELALYQNYPNPFNPETTIQYSLKELSDVKLKVYNIIGAEIYSLVDQKQNKGLHKINFNGNMLTSGIYFYRLSVNDKVVSNKKMMLLK